MENPYVISAELDLVNAGLEQLVKKEAIENFRETLDADLRAMGKETLWVPSSRMQSGLEKDIQKTSLPVVSLDDRYVSSADQYLGISRGVRGIGDPYDFTGSWPAPFVDAGYVPRVGYEPIAKQLSRVAELGSEIVLADDVLFSGEMVAWLSSELEAYGVKIGAVICGIAIQEGIEKLDLEGIAVSATETFDQVEDELCERDFAMVPGSGRRADRADIDDFYPVGANVLYFDNEYGNPERWASIPTENTQTFCASSIARSRDLLKPEVPMSALGCFVGFSRIQGIAAKELDKVLERGIDAR